MRTFRAGICLILCGFCLSAAVAAEVTTESLLSEMTDLRGMAEFPDPPFTCQQFSSYDRAAVSPEENWFANGDRGHYLREEERDGRTEHVMMDAEGPGAIVRIWSANPSGTLRIYLDGEEAPMLEVPMGDLLGGKVPGFPVPIAGERSRGWNCYFPIPYAEHCKVTSDEGGFYYHVNYRTYPRGTEVETFRLGMLGRLGPEIKETALCLSQPRQCGSPGDTDPVLKFDRTVEAGGSAVLGRLSGEKVLALFRVKASADDPVSALRQTVLRMGFDGEETVECPIGDFFGTAPAAVAYSSLPMGVTKDGMFWSHWRMPFREEAVIEVHNLGSQPVTIRGEIGANETEWTDNSMLFHAQWKTEKDIPSRPMRDWTFIDTEGKGVFAGAAMYVTNPVQNWWGEGDEKIYVDGEGFPSHFGTGTEDYFGYAWCCNEPFQHAYHNQPRCDGPGNYGNTSVIRWHIIDRIPFRERFRFDMEIWHHRDDVDLTVAAVSYWYARPGAAPVDVPLTVDDLALSELQRHLPPRLRGAIEGEEMKVLEKVGSAGVQGHTACSGGQHLWWSEGAKPGDRLVLGFPVEEAGRYRVIGGFLEAGDYGIVQCFINGKKAGKPVDLGNDSIAHSGDVDLGVFDLEEGENRLTLEIVGTRNEGPENYKVSLDYLILEPAE